MFQQTGVISSEEERLLFFSYNVKCNVFLIRIL